MRTIASPLASSNPTLALGVQPLDGDRERLLELLKDLHCEVIRGRPEAQLRATRDALAAVAAGQLEAEERLLGCADYPDLEEHAGAHAWFLERLAALALDDPRAALSALDFLRHWLLAHQLDADRKCGTWLHRRGADGRAELDGARDRARAAPRHECAPAEALRSVACG